jgi:hypothetical protein
MECGGVVAYDPDMADVLDPNLTRAWATWEREREHLLAEHEGAWALIVGDTVAGVFATERACLDEGQRRCGDHPFLPKLIVPGDEVLDLGFIGCPWPYLLRARP